MQTIEEKKAKEKAERLKKAFNYLKLEGIVKTQEGLGKMLGYDKATISQAFNGSIKHLTDSLVHEFCKKFRKINEDWINNNKGEMLRDNSQKKEPTQLEIDFNTVVSSNAKMADAVHIMARSNEALTKTNSSVLELNAKLTSKVLDLLERIEKKLDKKGAVAGARGAATRVARG